jgi:hypothetical protein
MGVDRALFESVPERGKVAIAPFTRDLGQIRQIQMRRDRRPTSPPTAFGVTRANQ